MLMAGFMGEWFFFRAFFKVIIKPFNIEHPLTVNSSFVFSTSVFLWPPCATVTATWCRHVIKLRVINVPAARREVNIARGAAAGDSVTARSPAVLGARRGARVPEQQRSELCESLLTRARWWISFIGVLELLAVMGSTCLAGVQSAKREPEATAERWRERRVMAGGRAAVISLDDHRHSPVSESVLKSLTGQGL